MAKVKSIESRRWHKDKKRWSFPNTDGTLEKVLKVFEGEEVRVDPALQIRLPSPVIAMPTFRQKQSLMKADKIPSPLVPAKRGVGEGKGEGNFQDLRRELLLRKYIYKTVKASDTALQHIYLKEKRT